MLGVKIYNVLIINMYIGLLPIKEISLRRLVEKK